MTTYLMAGLVLGGIYAISALGLVLTCTVTGTFNFAHGATAFVVALVFHHLQVAGLAPLPAAAVAAGLVAPALGVALWAVLFRHLEDATPATRLVSTIGLFVALPAAALLVLGDEPVFRPVGIGGPEPAVVDVAGTALNANQIAVVVAAPLVAGGLALLLARTRAGLLMRAAVDAPDMARLTGADPSRVAAGAWALGSALAGLTGVLITPLTVLSPGSFSALVIAGFGAAVVARFRSLPRAFAGAMAIGVLQGVAVAVAPESGPLAAGLQQSIPFLVMVGALLLGRPDTGRRADVGAPQAVVAPRPFVRTRAATAGRAVAGVALAGVAIAVLPPYWVTLAGSGLAIAVVFLGHTLLAGGGGIISLCQVTLAGVGAAVTSQLAGLAGLAVLPAVVAGALVAGVVGALVALPALRLADLHLALLTLGFALLADSVLFTDDRLTGTGAGVAVPRPTIGPVGFADDRAALVVLAAFLLLALLVVRNVGSGTSGLALAALRDSPPALASTGIGATRLRIETFAVAGTLAGLGGGLLVMFQGAADVRAFDGLTGVLWFAVLVTWGVRPAAGAVVAGLVLALTPVLLTDHLPPGLRHLDAVLFGIAAILLARNPAGALAVRVPVRAWARAVGRPARRAVA